RIRTPMPAASTIAERGVEVIDSYPQGRDVGPVPALQIAESGMRQRAPEIGPYARHVTNILRLAVALLQAGENAENLRGALRGKRRVSLRKLRRVEHGIALAARARV